MIHVAARGCLVFALIFWVACLWGIHVPLVSQFTAVFFDAAVILALSLLLWQFIGTWIERKIAESIPEESEDTGGDDEWGAAAHGRAYTLLPMIRKFIGSILVVMVSMTILSSMGVDIGPLLAGAGVIGPARREAFKRITEALSAKGIQYAHRRVIVDIPASAAPDNMTREQLKATGAAAFQDTGLPQNIEPVTQRRP